MLFRDCWKKSGKIGCRTTIGMSRSMSLWQAMLAKCGREVVHIKLFTSCDTSARQHSSCPVRARDRFPTSHPLRRIYQPKRFPRTQRSAQTVQWQQKPASTISTSTNAVKRLTGSWCNNGSRM
eukprot:754804-Hanusia_phi.AAC.2